MSTTTAIITDGYRESNLIAVGVAPTTAQQTEALTLLRRLIAAVYGFDVGEELLDWPVGWYSVEEPDTAWTELYWQFVKQNSRVMLRHEAAQTLYFPQNPNDGARIRVIDAHNRLATYSVTLDGNGNLIGGAPTAVLNTNGTNIVWFYNASTMDWVAVGQLALGDEMPFPEEFDDYFITKLAMRLSPRYGRGLSDATLAMLAEVQERMVARYRQTSPQSAPIGVQNLSTPNRGTMYAPRRGKFGWMA